MNIRENLNRAESFLNKINPVEARKRFKEAVFEDQLEQELDVFFSGVDDPEELTVDYFKEYLVSTGVIDMITPDMDALISERFFNKVNSQEGYEGIEDNTSSPLVGPEDLQPGDLLDMGEYGTIVFIQDYDGERFWGTDNPEDFATHGTEAAGWYCYYNDIEDVMDSIDEDTEVESNGELEEDTMFNTSVSGGSVGSTTMPGTPGSKAGTVVSRDAKIKALQSLSPNQDPDFLSGLSKMDDKGLDTMLAGFTAQKKTV